MGFQWVMAVAVILVLRASSSKMEHRKMVEEGGSEHRPAVWKDDRLGRALKGCEQRTVRVSGCFPCS